MAVCVGLFVQNWDRGLDLLNLGLEVVGVRLDRAHPPSSPGGRKFEMEFLPLLLLSRYVVFGLLLSLLLAAWGTQPYDVAMVAPAENSNPFILSLFFDNKPWGIFACMAWELRLQVTVAPSLPFPLSAPCPNTLAPLQHDRHPVGAIGRGLSRPQLH